MLTLEQKTFEECAREAGCASLVYRHAIGVGDGHCSRGPWQIALARGGAFVVGHARTEDIPRTKKRTKSKTRVYVITHVASGLKLGKAMTRKDAFSAIAKLALIPASTSDEIRANRVAILACVPGETICGDCQADTYADPELGAV